ncbi:efflux RND transporter periplasmic adaptor subunit [Granulicella paludicola]|uniref:efflux RND transporter periplasmic adaptor subunit n=1 Tax=Granulicella paludicola TaxID=474951 RepID=UPI0021E0BAFC|nr:efflux RND transporter periplasmic adaptor subunit [Granulicella paludicola]
MMLNRQQHRDTRVSLLHRLTLPCAFAALTLSGCKDKAPNPADEAPGNPQVVETGGSSSVTVKNPSRFSLTQSISQPVVSSIDVTGSVNPDVSREIPVLSLANGRVVALHVGLGDTVHKGQLVMEVQSPDVATAFNAYLKAVNDEHLTSVTLTRDKLLYDKGAIPKSQLEGAQDGEDDARADLISAEQQLKIYGVDKNHPGDSVKIYAPASGVIIAQNVTAAGATGITYAGNTGSLTIADLSHVWVIVDVYENDLKSVHLGQHADIHLNAYPGKTYSGTISDIGAQLDPSLRTAKVRIQVQNPNNELRLGMFATATLSSSKAQEQVAVPTTAILQLHDRSYVFVPGTSTGNFRRVEVKTGRSLDNNMVEILSGLATGQQVVANALSLQNTADQE